MNRDHARGASKSLNRTITEIMTFLGDDSERPGRDLRAFLHARVGDLAEHWYRKGFKRGHTESHAADARRGNVPNKLTYECSRTLWLGQKRKLILKSTIAKKAKRHKSTS